MPLDIFSIKTLNWQPRHSLCVMIQMPRMYTRSGDKGETGLFSGERVPKDSLRVEAYGTVDELSSWIGYARSLTDDKDIDHVLENL